jgi:ribose transport system substrate-binding protein
MKRKLAIGLIMLLTLSLILSACASKPAQQPNAPKKFKVGITTFGLANNYIRVGRDVATAQIQSMGGEVVATVDPDVSGRIAAIENMTSQGVDAIIVHEGDITQVEPALQEAKKKGIKIIAMNSGYSDVADLVVEPDNAYLGKTAAEQMVKLMGGKGNVVEIFNDAGAMIKARKDAMHDVIKAYPDIKITNGFVYAWPDFYPDAKAKMEAVLQANSKPGDIKAVFATFYGVGLAAAQAIRDAGLQNDIIVVGIDSDPETYTEMQKPDSPYKVSVISDPEQLAKTTIQNVFEMLKGNQIAEKHILIPGSVITKDNIPQAK